MTSDTLRQVTGTLHAPDGIPYVNQTLEWFRQRRVPQAQGSKTVLDQPFFVTTDASGQIDASVYAGNYTVRAKLKDQDRYFNVAVPDEAGPFNIADLLDVPAPPASIITQIQSMLIEARAWAENPEDVEVDPTDYPGEFSARHHAIKAAASADAAAAYVPAVIGFSTKADAEVSGNDFTPFDAVATLGRSTLGDGGGAAYLRTISAVRGGFADQNGQNWAPSLDSVIRPETFGAKGGDPLFDDSIGIQEMFDAVMENSINGIGFASLRPGQKYYCGDGADLIVDPGFLALEGNGGQLIFNKSASDPAAEPELLADSSFDGAGGWTGFSSINAAYQDYLIAGGQAVYSGAAADAGTYGGLYQQVNLVQGEWYRFITDIDALTYGGNQQYLAVNVRTGGPDAGGSQGVTYGPSHAGTVQQHDFKWTEASGTYWMQVKSNNPVTLNSVSLKRLPRNTCIEMNGDYSPFAVQYSPVLGAIEWRNLAMRGIDGAADWGIGILANTDRVTYRSQYNLRNVVIENFGVGLQTANRAYIGLWDGGGVKGCKTANILFGVGQDAGENMRLENMTVSNTATGVPGIVNRARYVHMTGCSIDYVGGAFLELDGGYIHAERCHFEKTGPAAGNYPFKVTSGTLILDKGYCQLNLNDPTTMDHVFEVGAGGRVVVDKMQAFGWITTTGELMTGAGHGTFRLSGIGQKSVSGFPTKTEKHSLNRFSSVREFLGDTAENWKYCVHDSGTRVSAKETSNLKAEPLMTGERTPGQKGIKVTRLANTGDDGVCYLAIPAPRHGMVSQEFYIKITANGAATPGETGDVFLDWWQACLVGDENGVFMLPEQGSGLWWGGEFNEARDVEWAAGLDWTLVSRNGAHGTNPAGWGQEFGADWRTHWVLVVNVNNLPVGSEVHICDLVTGVV